MHTNQSMLANRSGSGSSSSSSTQLLPVAVDTMGGDLGFAVQVVGAVEAYKDWGLK